MRLLIIRSIRPTTETRVAEITEAVINAAQMMLVCP